MPDGFATSADETAPEQEALLADSVGLALFVVLDTLAQVERLAFVLHDIFGVPFDETAPIVERSPEAARKLASRARQRVRGVSAVAKADLNQQRTVVAVFLQAARRQLCGAPQSTRPDVVLRADGAAVALGGPGSLRGATTVAKQFSESAQAARLAFINGAIVAPNGHVLFVLNLAIINGTIVAIDVVAKPAYLRHLNVVILDDPVSL